MTMLSHTVKKNLDILKEILADESVTCIEWFRNNKMQVNPDKFQAIMLGKSRSSLTFCSLLLPLWESVIVISFVVRCFVSVLVLQSS